MRISAPEKALNYVILGLFALFALTRPAHMSSHA